MTTTTPAAPAPVRKSPVPSAADEAATKHLPSHPGQHWLAIMEEKGLSESTTVRLMGCRLARLSRVLHATSIPTAPLTVAFARATDSDVTALWREVADYELAVAMLYDKGWSPA